MQLDNIPQHIAIIMDGNGRWANEREVRNAVMVTRLVWRLCDASRRNVRVWV